MLLTGIQFTLQPALAGSDIQPYLCEPEGHKAMQRERGRGCGCVSGATWGARAEQQSAWISNTSLKTM